MTASPATDQVASGASSTRAHGEAVGSVSFLALLLTQLLTAINDNVFRWLAIGVGKDYVDQSQVGLILMAGTACFVVPYLVLAAPAGYLADRFSKRNVIVGCKVAEILIMALGVVAIAINVPPMVNLILLFTAVGLMGAQSALFSPSKMGSIPELLRSDQISVANGLFGLATVSATVIGMAVGSWLSEASGQYGKERWWLSAVVLLSIALAGTLLSLMIRRLPVANPQRTFPWDAAGQTWRDLRKLASNLPLFRVALGVVFFWSVGALAQLNVDQFAFESGALYETDKVPLLLALVLGVGFGSVLAGIWSGGRIELGILPLGAFGVAVCSMLLFTTAGSLIDTVPGIGGGMIWALVLLFLLGTSAGMFSVPLEAYMQHRSPPRERGAVLAAMNFMVFTGILLAALLFAGLRRPTFPGSLDNVPTLQTQRAELDAAQSAQLRQLTAQFRSQWQRASAADSPANPTLQPLLDQAGPEVRPVALAELLWIELQARSELGQELSTDSYLDQFQDGAEKQLAKQVLDQSADLPLMTARQIFLVAGLFTVPVFLYIVFLIPQASVRFAVWLASHTAYRIRVHALENLPERGGAVLVANHVSWLDGILLLLTSSRQVHIVAFAANLRSRPLRWLIKLAGVILVTPGKQELKAALEAARQALRRGEIVGVFPEGGMTRSGVLQAFRPGVLRVLQGTRVPVIPVYLDELWGSIFSYEGGRYLWKWPRKWPYPISIHFGTPLARPTTVFHMRQAVQELGANAVQQRTDKKPPITIEFLRSCKKQRGRAKVADSTGAELTGSDLLLRTLILRRLLRREVLDADEQYVGLLLPPSAPAVVANAALAIDKRVSVNLNYTVSQEVVEDCIRQAGIRHVLTSRSVMNKLGLKLDANLVYLEDLRDKVTWRDKVAAAVATYAVPAGLLASLLGLKQKKSDDVLTIIFTSGSTGQPKGVMLTYGNVSSNCDAVEQVVAVTDQDVLLGILPFFHSFGFTVTIWLVLALRVKGVYHFNPLDFRRVGKLCREHGATFLVATPTFLRTYLRRCEKEEFASLQVLITGAERLPPDVADAFEEKFGIRPLEGYGCTETGPVASVNIPASRCHDSTGTHAKEGTVGRPIPGVSAKVVHLETGEPCGPNEPGMLWIKGPNIMKGYLGMPELTEQVVRDGWYVTGDVAAIDEDGFIRITGRESRFSKIGGEMVPHIRIEEELANLIGKAEDGFKAAVTAVADPRKGERLIVLHTKIDLSPDDLCKGLKDAGLPNLFIPSPDSFLEVEHLPILGTGKLDLKRIRELAREKFGHRSE